MLTQVDRLKNDMKAKEILFASEDHDQTPKVFKGLKKSVNLIVEQQWIEQSTMRKSLSNREGKETGQSLQELLNEQRP